MVTLWALSFSWACRIPRFHDQARACSGLESASGALGRGRTGGREGPEVTWPGDQTVNGLCSQG